MVKFADSDEEIPSRNSNESSQDGSSREAIKTGKDGTVRSIMRRKSAITFELSGEDESQEDLVNNDRTAMSIEASGILRKGSSVYFDVDDSESGSNDEGSAADPIGSHKFSASTIGDDRASNPPLERRESTISIDLGTITDNEEIGIPKEGGAAQKTAQQVYQKTNHMVAMFSNIFRFWGGLTGRLDYIFETLDHSLYQTEMSFQNNVEQEERAGEMASLAARKAHELNRLNVAGRKGLDGKYVVDDR